MGKKVKKFNRIKEVKRMSREDTKVYGKGGPHKLKKEKRKRSDDYLTELEEDNDDKD